MNFFEVLVTNQSVILGLAATRVLQATEHVFFKKHSYPKIYLIWIRLCLFILMSFWTLMNYSKLGNYNFLDFTFQSIYAGTVYIMCNAIFPIILKILSLGKVIITRKIEYTGSVI